MSYNKTCFAPTCYKQATQKWQYNFDDSEFVYTCSDCNMSSGWELIEVSPPEGRQFEPTRGRRPLP